MKPAFTQPPKKCNLCDESMRRVVYGRTATTKFDGVVWLCDLCDAAGTIDGRRRRVES